MSLTSAHGLHAYFGNPSGSRKPTRCKESEPQNPQDPGDDKNGPVPETPPGERKSPFLQGSIHQESTGAVSRSTEHTSPLKTARYRTEPEDTVQQRYTPPSSNTASNTLERRQSKRRKLSHGSETGTSTALVSPSHSDDTVNPKVSSGGGEAHRSNTDEGAQRECLQPTRPHPIASPPAKRKVLRLNQNGTLLSPPKEKATQDSQLATPDKQDAKPRGRRKRRPQLLVIIRYGTSDETRRREVGEAIDKLCGMSTEQPKAPSTTRALHPSKPTHPFFSGKARNEDVTEASRASQPATREPERVAASPSKIKAFTTPVKMRQATTVAQAPVESLPLFSRGSSGSKKPTMSGLYEPCWPWRGSNHVRPSSAEPSSKALMGNTALFHRRRRKDKPEWINKKNEVLSSDLGVVKNVIENSTPDLKHGSDVSAKASVPRRSVESRQTLRSKTITALDVCLRVKGSITCNALLHKHPALKSVYDRIGRTLSAFDHGECESRTWSQMYAPKRAKHVLQTQDETNLLRAWLARSTVDSVEMKLAEVGAPRPSILRQSSEDKLQKAKYKTRRKRRSEELDGFVVSSDDDVDMETVTQDDMSPTEAENHVGGDLKSMIRGSNGTSASQPRKMNCVLLSGPSGCGKTAAAYAVAQELGFDVFEIGPGSRRSGKDVLDRVGDLARNHQVRRRETITDTPLLDDGDDPHDEQQQSLTAFFNPASKPKRGRPSKKIAVPASGAGEAKKQQAQRKQALILLEEVDVLFEDDKQFWETVSDLAQQSRRPIIMTCNNETLLPMESLSLHAILRFKPVPDELAAVYLLLVAAAEGHLLAYEAVDALYKSKGSDLRATLAELQLRCQMGVGDDKGGLNWYLKRWPPGCDVDENGDVLHVVSSDTFARGMGFLPYRLGDEQARMEDIILQASSAHDVDPTILAETALEQSTSSSADQDGALTPSDNYAYLVDYSGWLDNLSAVDILSRVDVPVQDMTHDTLDPTLPALSSTKLASYTTGHPVLQASAQRDYPNLSSRIRNTLSLNILQCIETQNRLYNPTPAPATTSASLHTTLLTQIESQNPRKPTPQKAIAALYATTIEPLLTAPSSSTHPPPDQTTDTAPYARSIIAYDLALEAHRAALTDAFADGGSGNQLGRAAKRARTTRASRSALEGGARASTRRERWFGKEWGVNYGMVMRTAGVGWPRCEGSLVAGRFSGVRQGKEGSVEAGAEGSIDGSRASSVMSGG